VERGGRGSGSMSGFMGGGGGRKAEADDIDDIMGAWPRVLRGCARTCACLSMRCVAPSPAVRVDKGVVGAQLHGAKTCTHACVVCAVWRPMWCYVVCGSMTCERVLCGALACVRVDKGVVGVRPQAGVCGSACTAGYGHCCRHPRLGRVCLWGEGRMVMLP